MQLISHTHALIIDLRKNSGGSPAGVIFWNSYLFPDSQTHLNNIYDGATGETRQFWSLAYVPGERYLDRRVYVLISEMTFSGGEEFCYNLKTQGRATLIGQTTGGGAHPTQVFPLPRPWK
jgi:C-terminal processing protease CtpA/Prc